MVDGVVGFDAVAGASFGAERVEDDAPRSKILASISSPQHASERDYEEQRAATPDDHSEAPDAAPASLNLVEVRHD